MAVDGADAGGDRLVDVLAIERAAGRAIQAVRARRGRMGGLRSMGLPKPSRTRPTRSGPTATCASRWRAMMRSCSWMPSISSSGMESTWPSRKPITCVRMRRPAEVDTSQKSPTATAGPREATSMPTSSTTSPVQGSSWTLRTCAM